LRKRKIKEVGKKKRFLTILIFLNENLRIFLGNSNLFFFLLKQGCLILKLEIYFVSILCAKQMIKRSFFLIHDFFFDDEFLRINQINFKTNLVSIG